MTPTFHQAREWFTPLRQLRFWRKVNKALDGCWLWAGSLTDTGHGQYQMGEGTVRVHRLTWILARERDIPDWMVIRHLMCVNKACCNPAHLVGGTPGDNNHDRVFHSAYDEAEEQGKWAEYLSRPYIGFFSDVRTLCTENNPPFSVHMHDPRLDLPVHTLA